MKYLTEKYILRKAMKAHLPLEILGRKKRGLATPYSPWLKGDLPDPFRQILSADELKKKGYFNPSAVGQLLKQHKAGKENYSRALMAVLGVQIWDEIFMKGCKSIGTNGHVE
jgi:asparagine synthase (glutamine-hydrolysing)